MNLPERGPRCSVALILLALLLAMTAQASLDPTNYVVPLTATVQTTPPQITINWPADPDSLGYTVFRKLITDTSWGSAITTVTNTATGFTDTNVAIGSAFEYQVVEPKD